MKKEPQIERNHYKAFIVFFLGIIGQVFVFVIMNYIGAIFSVTPIEALVLSGIIIVMGLICWIIARFLIYRLLRSGFKGRVIGISKRKKESAQIVTCSKNGSLLCPLNIGINEYGLVVKINETTSQNDRLFEKEYVYKKENTGKQGSPWKNIWIFSENLSSEIDPSNDRAEPVLISNITTNKTKYTIFYLSIESQISEIETRKTLLNNSISPKDKKLLSLIPIDVSSGYLGKNTLPLLCGSILFSQNENSNQIPIFSEGYLSIRKSIEDIPIYYKMPRCMLREYSKYFERIIYENGGKS